MAGDDIEKLYSKLSLASSIVDSIEKLKRGLKLNLNWAGKLANKTTSHSIPKETIFKVREVLMKDKLPALHINW